MYGSTVLASEKKATRCPRALPQQHSNLGFHKETGSRREAAASGLPHQACGWASRDTSDAAVGFHFVLEAAKTLSQMFVRSGEIPSPGQTSSDKNKDCAMKSERGTPVRGSDPPSGHSVYKTTGDRWCSLLPNLDALTSLQSILEESLHSSQYFWYY